MKINIFQTILYASVCLTTLALSQTVAPTPVLHESLPDGSAGISSGAGHFIGACDENNLLRLFAIDGKGASKVLLDLNPLLEFKPKNEDEFRECDIEGAARVGNRIYWIGSHGTNRKGDERKERQVLFATEVSGEGEATTLKLAGKPCKDLLAAFSKLEKHDLAAAAKIKPEAGGLNIESLCVQGETLLIGFRSPVPDEGALIVPLTNPRAVIEEGVAPSLGAAFTLELGGRGVRDMAPWNDRFLIIAGDYRDNGKPSGLYSWSGDPEAKPVELAVNFESLNPEAVMVHGECKDAVVRILSDDGGESFKSVTLELATPP